MRGLLFASLFVLCARPAWAQDMNAMLKWTEATIIHYKAVGEFSAKTSVLTATLSVSAPVTDRVEIEFDWNQQENKLVGKPVIRNFASKAGAVEAWTDCPAAKVGGPFEFATVLGLKDIADETLRMATPGVTMEVRRDYPAGEVPVRPNQAAAPCGSTWEKVAAKAVTESQGLGIPVAMMLAMGKPGGPGISADGKSFVNKSDSGTDAGWTWTFTPTIVK